MPYSLFRYKNNYLKFPCAAICAALAFILICLTCAAPLHAADPVEIVVTGIEGDALKNVQESLVLPSGLVREESVDTLWLERFSRQADNNIKNALEPFGYYNALVTVTVEQTEKRYRLLATVAPGEPARLTEVNVALSGPGNNEKRLLGLIATFPLHTGDVLLHQKYEGAKESLLSLARELGYLDAEFSLHEIRVARSATTATIELILDTGRKYLFGATHIRGAPDYPDNFLRRYLVYKPDEVFSYAALGETQRNFANSERFKEIIVTPDKQDAEALKVPVTVQLAPGPRISLRPGIGYGTDTGARFTVRYRDLNMLHLGHELYSNLYIAERLQGLVTGYILPSPTDIRSSTTLQMNLQQETTSLYFSKIAALELDRNRSFGKGKMGTAYIKAQYEEYTVGIQNSDSRLLLPGVRFSDNRYDNPVRPHHGFRYALDVRGTHQLLGSDTALLQVLAEGSYLVPLPWRLSLHTRAKGAATLLDDHFSTIPPSLRFFTGGDQSVRGYSYQSLGPRDAAGKVTGGKQLLTGSVELERALFTDWGVSIFYDAGNTFNTLSNAGIAQGAGVGLHYYTSVGGLNLSIAKPLQEGSSSIHIHFTVGFEL